jgi:hypothetical protein
MKTTVDIADPLLRQAKRLAARRGITLRDVVEAGLRKELAGDREAARPPLRTHCYEGKGLQAGLDWGDWAAIRALSYEGRGG